MQLRTRPVTKRPPGQNQSPRACMHRLGYSYLNRALDAAGFFDAQSKTGMWMATDYGDWKDFNVAVATKSAGAKPENGTSSAAMTALAMDNPFGHMHRGKLVDAAASTTMRAIFRSGGAWLSTLGTGRHDTLSSSKRRLPSWSPKCWRAWRP